MGVSGCGKSTVGVALAERLGGTYVDGDDLHPAENIAKMSIGTPLQDTDRWPWLDRVGEALASRQETSIIGCSALKRTYRDRIRTNVAEPVLFIHLSGTREEIARRMRNRPGHFMPASLLDSQFAALEPPTLDEYAVTVAIDQPLVEILQELTGFIGMS
ncbi:gluconokinase [Pararhizobium sp. BT-229]|uniref:gluconokinase n=1 Tax=Pararhizobium sp. BT-229 TaxID=2986923 RepID=UPI0021F7D19D|nr:gluconokinase [Pararhizobium sp. BT-229]MCV9962548.1 gluconokinase [Pararhizobium sp. BT-229]